MDWLNLHILSILIWWPVLGALLLALAPRAAARQVGLTIAVINFVLSLHLWRYWHFDAQTPMQFESKVSWLPQLGIYYHLGVDGTSLFLVLLTTFLTPLVMLSSWKSIQDKVKAFGICLLLLEASAIGVFTALDLIVFYIFWEAVLIPAYVLIGLWGGPRRMYAGIKFFMYTMVGSVLMWLAILYLYVVQSSVVSSNLSTSILSSGRSFDFATLRTFGAQLEGTNSSAAQLLFLAFALAFAIKAPLFPFHTWLPDAYTEAPTGGTIMIAAVLSKMGAYGFLRLAIPMFPATALQFAPAIMMLSTIGIIYGAMVAIAQTDMKRMIAYSSISHIGFIMLGIFGGFAAYQSRNSTAELASTVAVTGSTLQMFNHGISIAALFLLVGILSDRCGTREIGQFGGLAKVMPRFTIVFWIALFASIGLPGLNGFVGEFLILQGTMEANFWYAALAAIGVILGAVYMLRMFGSVMFGEITNEAHRTVKDLSRRELVVVGLLLAVAVWVGVAPQPFLYVVGQPSSTVAQMVSRAPSRSRTYNLAVSAPATRIAPRLALRPYSPRDSVSAP